MSSKTKTTLRRIVLGVMGVSAALSLSACGDFLKGKKKEAEVIELSDESFACLRDLPQTIEQTLEAKAGVAKIKTGFTCMKDALTSFGQRTRGQTAETYSASDLEKFFSKYMMKNRQIPRDLVDALMRLKSVLMGGTTTHLTKLELARLTSLMSDLEVEVIALERFFPLFLMKKKFGDVDEGDIDQAARQLRESVRNLLKKVELVRSNYTFDELRDFVISMMAFAKDAGVENVRGDVSAWLPLVEGVKEIFFGETARFQGERDWLAGVDSLIELGTVAFKFRYLVPEENHAEGARKVDFLSPQVSTLLVRLADKLLTQLEKSHAIRTTDRIEFSAIERVIQEAAKLQILPSAVGGPDACIDLFHRIVIRMMDPQRAPTDALKRTHLMMVRREFDLLRTVHEFYLEAYGSSKSIRWDDLVASAKRFDANSRLASRRRNSADYDLQLSGWNHFIRLIDRQRPVVYMPSGRILISLEPKADEQSWDGMMRFALSNLMVRGFMLGYGDHADPVRARFREQDLVQWYADFKKFGIAIKAFDPRSDNSGARSFKEASFFTYAGNGDEFVVFDEMFEFTSFLFAGGLGNVNALQDYLESAQSGCALREQDIFGYPWLQESCVYDRLRTGFSEIFDNLPGMSKAVQEMSDQEWFAFMSDWMSASRTSSPTGGKIETADLRTGVMILYYVESLFTMYDTNKDGVLDVPEIRAGSPRFISFIKELSPIKQDWFVREAFVAMVLTGKKPDGWDMASYGGGRLSDWLGFSDTTAKASRANILRVLKNLKSELSKPKAADPAP